MLPKLNKSQSQKTSNSDDNGIRSCKVTSIVLDDSHKLFNELGGWNSIGTITFTFIDESNTNLDISSKDLRDNIATPLNPNSRAYPLLNELVYLIRLPTIPKSTDSTNTTWYYFSSINLINSPHQNSYVLSDKTGLSYSSAGIPFRNSKSTANKTPLGQIFKDNPNVHPILPFEGDVIFEGRHGTSLRLGGTSGGKFKTQWTSDTQANYFVLSGHTSTKPDNIHIIEDINADDYIIAGFSDHQLKIDLPCLEFGSYNMAVNSAASAPEQLYEVNTGTISTEPTSNVSNTPTEIQSTEDTPIIQNDIVEPTQEFYNESEGDFETPEYVYVLPDETVNERANAYTQGGDVDVINVNVIPYSYLSFAQLTKILRSSTTAAKYLKPLNQTLTLYKINNNKRIAHFLSQCLIESAHFTRMSEIGNKSYFEKYEKPGNQLGNDTPGSGYKYRGRGIIQITGKYNYTKFFRDMNYGVVNDPDLLMTTPLNIISAGWYWNMRKLNSFADVDSFPEIRKRVQGSSTNRISDIKTEYNNIINILSNGTA